MIDHTDHVMLDLETFGTGNEAAIIAIGAVKFDPSYSVHAVYDSFYIGVDPASSIDRGMRVDGKTLLWWLNKDQDEARKAYLSSTLVDLPSALDGFSRWFGNKSIPTWGNGATFDNVILRHAFKLCGMDCPWIFREDRCFRTLKSMSKVPCPTPPDNVEHHALADALRQAYWMKDIVRDNASLRF